MSTDRLREWVSSVPLGTVSLFAINTSIHVLIFLFSTPLGYYAISPARVIYQHEFYRLGTSAFVHSGILHIGMNMMSLLQLGTSVESQFGSTRFLFLTVWTVFLTNILYVSLSWLLTEMTGSPTWIGQPAVGFSGVLFTYALLDCYHATMSTRSLFGMIEVPAKLYPWIILILIQVILPNISFLGHLSGILVGLMAVYGLLCCMIPSHETCSRLERSRICSSLFSQSNFVLSTDKSLVTSTGNESMLSSIIGSIQWILLQIWNVFATILHIVGCPVDSMTNYASARYAAMINYFNSPSRASSTSTTTSSGPPGRAAGRRLGGGSAYSPLNQSEDRADQSAATAIDV